MKGKAIRPEIFIIVLLILCVSYIIHFEQDNGRTGAAVVVNSDGQVAILHRKEEMEEYKSSGRYLMEYRPDACQLVEVLNEDMETVFSLSFTNDDSIQKYVNGNPGLFKIYESKKMGKSDIVINDKDYSIDFTWDDVDGTKYLIVYASSQIRERTAMFFNFVCYITLILSFTMFTNTLYWQHRSILKRYKQVNREVKSRIL